MNKIFKNTLWIKQNNIFFSSKYFTTLYFLEEFQVYRKIERKVQRFPPLMCPASPIINILQLMNLHWYMLTYSLHRVDSWCYTIYTFYGFWQKYTDMYPRLQDHRQYSCCHKNPLCSPTLPHCWQAPTLSLFPWFGPFQNVLSLQS